MVGAPDKEGSVLYAHDQRARVHAEAVEVKKSSCLTGVLSICAGEVQQASTANRSLPTGAACVEPGDASKPCRIR